MEHGAAERLAEAAFLRLRHIPMRRFKNNYTQRKQLRRDDEEA
jgi:hypothetical protein